MLTVADHLGVERFPLMFESAWGTLSPPERAFLEQREVRATFERDMVDGVHASAEGLVADLALATDVELIVLEDRNHLGPLLLPDLLVSLAVRDGPPAPDGMGPAAESRTAP